MIVSHSLAFFPHKRNKGSNKYKSPQTSFPTRDLEYSWCPHEHVVVAEKNIQVLRLRAAVKCSFSSSDWVEMLLVAPRWWGQQAKSQRSSILLSVDGSITTWKECSCSQVVPSSKLLYSNLKWKTRQREAEDKFRLLLHSTFHQIVVYSRGNECMFLFMIYAWFI